MKHKSVIVCMFSSNLLKIKIPEDMIECKDRQEYKTIVSDREKSQLR